VPLEEKWIAWFTQHKVVHDISSSSTTRIKPLVWVLSQREIF